jgi:FkbH-like protein
MVFRLGAYPRITTIQPQTLPQRKLLFLGTCQAGALHMKACSKGMAADHILCESYQHSAVPSVDSDYDAVVVGLTARHIHIDASKIFDDKVGIGGCFYWPRFVIEGREQEYFDACADLVARRVDHLCETLNGRKFFLAFIEPKHNYLGNLMPRYRLSNPAHFAHCLNKVLAEAVERHPNAYFLDTNEIISMVGNMRTQDDYISTVTHGAPLLYIDESACRIQPSVGPNQAWESETVIDDFLELLIERLNDDLRIIEQPLQTKAIIVDLDDTLWRGVAAEGDPGELGHTEGWPLGMAEALLIYKARGGMLAICSKNDREVIEKKFDEIYWGRIRLSDFASIRINHERKSDNIRSILEELNILPENAMFVDDNPREIDEVAQVFPGMKFLSADHYDWRRQILMSPDTQVSVITEDATRRTESIQAKAARIQPISVSREEWLASLALTLETDEITTLDHPRFERAFELLNKTNQFNTTGRRWSRDEVGSLLASGGWLLCGMLRDRVADYGMVGVVIVDRNQILQQVLSCRAFGNNAEHALAMAAMTSILEAHPLVSASIVDTGRNKTCHRFFTELGFDDVGEGRFVAAHMPSAVPHIRIVDDTTRAAA